MIEQEPESQEWRKRTSYYRCVDYLAQDEYKDMVKRVTFKPRPYYTALYSGGPLLQIKFSAFRNYEGISSNAAQEIFDLQLPVNSFFIAENIKVGQKAKYKINDLTNFYTINIVDVFEGKKKICSTFVPCLAFLKNGRYYKIEPYDRYGRGFDIFGSKDHEYIAIIDDKLVSDRFLNEYYHRLDCHHSILSSYLEIDKDNYCYFTLRENIIYTMKLYGIDFEYEAIEKEISYTRYSSGIFDGDSLWHAENNVDFYEETQKITYHKVAYKYIEQLIDAIRNNSIS